MNVGNKIPQTMSAKSGVKGKNIPQTRPKEVKIALDSQAYNYYLELAENEIDQQSADHFLEPHINPMEFDGIRIQAEMWNPEPEPQVWS